MFTEERMKRMAQSRYNYFKLTEKEAEEVDRRILSEPEKLSAEDKIDNACRIRMLKNAGLLRCGSTAEGTETIAKTSTTASWLRRH